MEEMYDLNVRPLRVVTLVAKLLLFAHMVGCGWMAIANFAEDRELTWLAEFQGGVALDGPVTRQYILALNWALGVLCGGSKATIAVTDVEVLYATVGSLLGALIGEIGALCSPCSTSRPHWSMRSLTRSRSTCSGAICLAHSAWRSGVTSALTRAATAAACRAAITQAPGACDLLPNGWWPVAPLQTESSTASHPHLAPAPRLLSTHYYETRSVFDEREIMGGLKPELQFQTVSFFLGNSIGRMPLFSDMKASFLTVLFPLLKPVRCVAGDVVFEQGDESSNLYFLIEGSVAVLDPF
jgi:hypothetical protein